MSIAHAEVMPMATLRGVLHNIEDPPSGKVAERPARRHAARRKCANPECWHRCV